MKKPTSTKSSAQKTEGEPETKERQWWWLCAGGLFSLSHES
jgi:hypothetical protein